MAGVGFAMHPQHHRSLHSGINTLHDSKEQNEPPRKRRERHGNFQISGHEHHAREGKRAGFML